MLETYTFAFCASTHLIGQQDGIQSVKIALQQFVYIFWGRLMKDLVWSLVIVENC